MGQTQTIPPQHQDQQPGREWEMKPLPQEQRRDYRGSGKLHGKAALITGGDSGIGRAVALAFAREGADVAIVYLNETWDAQDAKRLVEQEGRKCIAIAGDIGDEQFCQKAVQQAVSQLGHLDILVNNAGEQHPQDSIEKISKEQLERTFRTNIFSQFYLTQAALPHLKSGSAIINTTSITAYEGSPELLDYSATKGAILAFTRSLSQALISKGIRVNCVAPGPIWTPLIPATYPADKIPGFGQDTPMKRPGQPEELAPAYVYLACEDSSYMAGQTLHINGGEIVNG